MLDSVFMKKLQELIDVYNHQMASNAGTTIPSVDKELREIMEKIERYINRYR